LRNPKGFISQEDAALGDKRRMVIERYFRALKENQIKLTPMQQALSPRGPCLKKTASLLA
jgi:hypothetical protein